MPKSALSVLDRFMTHVSPEPNSGCWLWTGEVRRNSAGKECGCFSMRPTTQKGRSHIASRVAYQLMVAPIPTGLLVRHKCDNSYCVNPDHLELGTHLDNRLDRILRNKDDRSIKMSGEEVVAARNAHAKEGRTIRSLATQYGVSYAGIWNIVNGRTRQRLAGRTQ